MRIKKVRYAYVTDDPAPQQAILEKISFIKSGTEGVSETDQRLVAITDDGGDPVDALFISVANPLYVMPTLPTEMNPTKRLNPATNLVETIDVPGDPIIGMDYYNSIFWDPLSLIIEAKYTLIDEDAYWDMMSAYRVAHTTV